MTGRSGTIPETCARLGSLGALVLTGGHRRNLPEAPTALTHIWQTYREYGTLTDGQNGASCW